MNWIGRWCKEHCQIDKDCDHCSDLCLPRFNIARAVNCSEYLIWILVNQNGGITHPEIANAIADYIGATAEERDSIVAMEHRGKWKPNTNRAFFEPDSSWQLVPRHGNGKSVVVVDRVGEVIARYSSITTAASRMRVDNGLVSRRCNHIGSDLRDEFEPNSFTFRFADEWDVLTPEERRANVRNMKERCNET